MIKNTKWQHGERDFQFPSNAIPPEHWGCGLARTVFDQTIGAEVCLIYAEQPPHADEFGRLPSMNLVAHCGVVATPHGPVAYIVWRIAAGSQYEHLVETFINPYKFNMIKLISDAANQTTLKFIIIDKVSRETTVMVDFENSFGLDRFLFGMAMSIAHEPETDMDAATQLVMDSLTTAQLVERALP